MLRLILFKEEGRDGDYAAQGGFVLSLELPEDDKYYDDKADILELNGLSEAASFVLLPNEEPSEQLLGFLRLINLSGKPLHMSHVCPDWQSKLLVTCCGKT